ncbi:FAD-binding oxidoreductase [Yoonia sp. SS1-5]|uniref:NAD(P)/FAD-dependent oxidoreductase n=1 Tax=Yoonia rhodophyticola TaxID=3137370 RepID=A0AAN0NJS6_9RHOB
MTANKAIPEEIHWHRTAPPPPDCSPLEGTIKTDVAIIGAGLTGLRTAVTLAEAGTQTIVMDAQSIGFGASGRSGGQCNPIWRATPDDLNKRFGNAQAERLVQTTLTSADDLFDDIRRYEIDCEAEQNGWLQTAHTRSAAKGIAKLGESWRAVGADIEEISGPELHAKSGSPEYSFGLRHAKGGFVQPMALTRGYAKVAQAHGAQLFEKTPATSIEKKDGKWHLRTPNGEVIADTVILTTNAYTDKLWPGLQQTVLPMVSVALATAPLTAAQQASVLPGRMTISDTRLAIYFARYDAGNRLIFGCVGSGDSPRDWGGVGRLRTGLRTVFPQIADIDIECSWAGRIGVTQEMMPHLHEPAPGVLAGVGFSGRGIAMTSVMGRTLARKVLGGANSDLAFPVTPIKPMPLYALSRAFVPLMAPAMSTHDHASVILDRGFRRSNPERADQ